MSENSLHSSTSMPEASSPSFFEDPLDQLLMGLQEEIVAESSPVPDLMSASSEEDESASFTVAPITRSGSKKTKNQSEKTALWQQQQQELGLVESQEEEEDRTGADDNLHLLGADGGALIPPGNNPALFTPRSTADLQPRIPRTSTRPTLPTFPTVSSASGSYVTSSGPTVSATHPPPTQSFPGFPMPSYEESLRLLQQQHGILPGLPRVTPALPSLQPSTMPQFPFGMPPTAQPEDHRLRPLLKPFHGTESASATMTWVFHLEAQAKLRQWSDETTVVYAAERFQGVAGTWYEARLRDPSTNAYRWSSLKGLFLNRFCPALTASQEENLRRQLQHAEGTSLVDFLDRCVQTADAIFISRGVDVSAPDYLKRRNQLTHELFLQKAHPKYRKVLCIQLRHADLTPEMIQEEARTLQAAIDLSEGTSGDDFAISAAPVTSNQKGSSSEKSTPPDQIIKARNTRRQRMLVCRRCNLPNHYSSYCTASDSELSYLQRRENRNSAYNSQRSGFNQRSGQGGSRFGNNSKNTPNTNNNTNSNRPRSSNQAGFRRRNVNAVAPISDPDADTIQPTEQQMGRNDSSVNTVDFPFLTSLDRKKM